MSTDNIAGYALGGEFNLTSFLKLLNSPKNQKRKIKYTGSRKSLRRLLKAKKEKEQSK